MGTSSISITSLTAVPTLRGNKLAAVVSATGPAANIPTLMLDTVEFFASTTNDFTTATKVVEGKPEALHAGLIEEQTYYYWAKARAVNANYGAVYPVSPTGGVACTALSVSATTYSMANGRIVPSVAGNALTVAIKTAAGNDPSASDQIFSAFRNAALGSGGYTTRAITAALSITHAGSGSLTPGTSIAFRIYVLLFDDGGTLRLGLSRRSSNGNTFPLAGQGIDSSSINDAPAGQICTTGSVVTSKAYKILGYMDWTSGLPTPGLWTVLPDQIVLFAAGIPTPGTVIQRNPHASPTHTTGTTLTPYDDTIPQRAESDNYASNSITVASIINIVTHEATICCSHSSGANPVVGAIHYQAITGGADALGVGWATPPAANVPVQINIACSQQAPAAGNLGYELHGAGTTAGTFELNGVSGGRKFGGALLTTWTLSELMG